MIPRIDPEVKYKGSSYLRTLNVEGLRELTGALVIQDAGSEPLVVIVPYQTYLNMQKTAQFRESTRDGLKNREEILRQSNVIRPRGDVRLDAIGPELSSGRGKATIETRIPRQKGDKTR